MWIIFSNNCTYCGGDIEDNFSSCGLAAAILLFPIGELYSLIYFEKNILEMSVSYTQTPEGLIKMYEYKNDICFWHQIHVCNKYLLKDFSG